MNSLWRFFLVAMVIAYAVAFAAEPGEPDASKSDYYEILGIDKNDPRLDSPDLAKKIIRDAYRLAAKKYRADVGQDAANFIKVTTARENLDDDAKRAEYERTLDLSGRRSRAATEKPTRADFLERDVAAEVLKMNTEVAEFVRHADLDALKEGAFIDEPAVWLQGFLKVFREQVKRLDARTPQTRIFILGPERAERSATSPSDFETWNYSINNAATTEFIRSNKDRLIRTEPYPFDEIQEIRTQLLPRSQFFEPAYELIEESMDLVQDVELYDRLLDQYVRELVEMPAFSDGNQECILNRYRQRNGLTKAKKLSVGTDLLKRADGVFSSALNLPKAGAAPRLDATSVMQYQNSLRTATEWIDRYLGLALRANVQNEKKVLSKSLELFRLTFTSAESGETEKNQIDQAAEVAERLRQTPAFRDFRISLRRRMAERILAAMEDLDLAREALAHPLFKEHLFETYLKAAEGTTERQLCSEAITANIRSVLRPPPGLPKKN